MGCTCKVTVRASKMRMVRNKACNLLLKNETEREEDGGLFVCLCPPWSPQKFLHTATIRGLTVNWIIRPDKPRPELACNVWIESGMSVGARSANSEKASTKQ